MRALVVDDARVNRRVLAAMLASFGCEVAGEAATIQEGVAAAVRCEPRVVLLDVGLIGEQPGEAIGRVLAAAPGAAVVACASFEQAGLLRRALAAGAHGMLTRPFVPALVGRTLAALG